MVADACTKPDTPELKVRAIADLDKSRKVDGMGHLGGPAGDQGS